MLDFDANATAKVLPAAFAAWQQAAVRFADAAAPASRAAVAEARAAVAASLGAQPDEVVFTSGGTAADAWVLQLACRAFAAPLRLAVGALEHDALRLAAQALAQSGKAVMHTLPADADGRVQPRLPDAAAAAGAGAAPQLYSLMLAHNETGVCQPVATLVAHARAQGAYVHTDAVQAVGRMAVDFAALQVDALSLAGHKVGALGGTGALLVRRGTPLWAANAAAPPPRAEANVPGIVALATALQDLPDAAAQARLRGLRDAFEHAIVTALGPTGCRVLGAAAPRLCNTSCLLLPGAEAEAVLMALDMQGYAISAGAACASGALEPSPSLRAMGLTAQQARQVVRVSLPNDVRQADLKALTLAFVETVRRARA